MNSIIQDLFLITPEVTLLFAALIVLMIGVYGSNQTKYNTFVLSISIFGILITLIDVLNLDAESISFHGMLYSNAFTTYAKILILLSGMAVVALLHQSIKFKTFKFEYPVLMMLSMMGMMFLVSSNSLISLFMSLELMSLPLYVLCASDRSSSISSEAGMKYFVLGALATGLYLFGASLIYGYTGTMDFSEISNSFASPNTESESSSIPIAFLIGLIFIIIAIAFKISAVPFHMWTPDVYQGAPTVVTAFLSSAPKIAGVALFCRILIGAFYDLSDQWQQIIIFMAIASMFVGSLGAIMQSNLKRLLAYSSIGHIGFTLVGLATAELSGLVGVILYMTIYLTMTVAIFGCLLLLKDKQGMHYEKISDLAGLSQTQPHLALAIAVIMFSMAGIPPLAGFFAKLYIILPALEQGMYGLAIATITASVIAAFYYLKVVKVMYFDNSKLEFSSSFGYVIPAVIFLGVIFNLIFIVIPTEVIDLVEKAVEVLFT
ncbi:MAG: NADH-quinone oxidoreductase subunit NuoN [Rickettsiales bacterium]